MDINYYKEVSHEYKKSWLSVFKDLLNYYQSKKQDPLLSCPLCQLSVKIDTENFGADDYCQFCPWYLYEVMEIDEENDIAPCETWFYSQSWKPYSATDIGISNFRKVKHSEFIQKRIPMLQHWIKIYK